MNMKILVTGGSGFIGSNFIQYLLTDPEVKDEVYILNVDSLTYAGQGKNIQHMYQTTIHEHFLRRYRFIQADIRNFKHINRIVARFKPDYIVNFAAESHNSLAILKPRVFFQTNVLGTQNLLEAARRNNVMRFHHISTCEVYGDLALDSPERFTEESAYKPNTPYNASKAAADLAVRAYAKTFGLPITISNCANNYGPYQFPEKLIPLSVTNILEGKKMILYKTSQNKREWIHVHDHCRAIWKILMRGRVGETYNVGTGVERSIEEISAIILKYLAASETMKEYVADRPAHDRRYLLDSTKIKNELGWKAQIDFEQGMQETVQWYTQNPQWWKGLKKDLLKENTWNTKR